MCRLVAPWNEGSDFTFKVGCTFLMETTRLMLSRLYVCALAVVLSVAIGVWKSAAVHIAKTVRCFQWPQAFPTYCRASTVGDLCYTAQINQVQKKVPPETWHTGPSETLYWCINSSFSLWWIVCLLCGGLLPAFTPTTRAVVHVSLDCD